MNPGKKFQFDNNYCARPQNYEWLNLYQIGDLSCKGGFEVDSHIQPCYEISYIVSGKGDFYTNGVKHPVSQGDIYINLPDEEHKIIADRDEPLRYFYMAFWFNQFKDENNRFAHIEKMLDSVEKPVIKDRLDINIPFMKALNEISDTGEYSQFMLETYLMQIAILAYRNFCSNWEFKYKPVNEDDSAQNVVYSAIAYIDRNVEKISELRQVAEQLGYNYSYLSHLFSEETGMTLQSYLNKKRMEKAIELIKAGGTSITEIAERLQYQSIHSFSKAFKKSIGVSPAQYQHFYVPKNENGKENS